MNLSFENISQMLKIEFIFSKNEFIIELDEFYLVQKQSTYIQNKQFIYTKNEYSKCNLFKSA